METLHIGVTGVSVTTGAAGQTAVPNAANGAKALRVMVSAIGAAGVYAHVRPTVAANGAVTDLPVFVGSPVILHIGGASHIGHIQGTAGAVIIITPLEG